MCDACINRARTFERSLTDQQRSDLRMYVQTEANNFNTRQYRLGYDNALAEDDVIFEAVVAQHDALRELFTALKPYVETNDGNNLAPSLVKGIETALDALPRSLRKAR